MNERNEAIALYLGWIFTKASNSESCDRWTHPKVYGIYSSPPNYYGDLNAMHEAWLTLDNHDKFIYWSTLKVVCANDIKGLYLESDAVAGNATAAQRAEAFCKTVGIWKEEK